jgi:imidazolonepropionase-like amidohydrolase
MRAVALLVLVVQLAHAAPDRPALAIVGPTVVDPGGATTPDATVLVVGNRIEAVGPSSRVKVPAGATRLDGKGTFVVPGLVDAHVHFHQSGGPYTRPDVFDLRAYRPYAEEQRLIREHLDETLARFLRNGVTSVADVGGPFWNFDVRDRARDNPRAPRVAVTGPLISSVDRPELNLGDPPIIRCAAPEEARALVRREAERKPDYIKIWFIVTGDQPVAKNRPIVEAAIQEAHALGLRAAVHATELATARAALESGADILVHSVDDAEVDDAFLRLARDRKAVYIPTLTVRSGYFRTGHQKLDLTFEELTRGDPWVTGTLFDLAHIPADKLPERMRLARQKPPRLGLDPTMAKNLMSLLRAGVTVAMGTDSGNIGTLHGVGVLREMAAMEEAGMKPLEVLQAATQGGARVMGREKELGRVAPGAMADLLVLDADPRTGTRALARIRRVVKDGQLIDPETLIADSPEALAQRQLNAYNARNLEAFLAPYAEDVELRDLDGKVVSKGKEAVRTRYGELFRTRAALHCELRGRVSAGSWVVDEERVTGAGDSPIHGLAIYEVVNGRIARVRFMH